MKIGELAERTGLTPSRIRFYERIGLLKTVDRQANGYRTYPRDAVALLKTIVTAQRAGFTLDELRGLLPDNLEAWDHAALLSTLRRKIADIETLEKRLAHSKAQLKAVVAQIESKPDDVACADNARKVLSKIQLGEFDGPSEAS